jgi:hypothetical protein
MENIDKSCQCSASNLATSEELVMIVAKIAGAASKPYHLCPFKLIQL